MAPKRPTVDPTGLQVNKKPVPRVTATIRGPTQLPVLQQVQLRVGRNFLGGTKRMNDEEAWLAHERGTIPPRACMHCRKSKPTGPFDTCLVVDGHLKESCTNCHYGGTGARYSFRDDYENALAQAEANENEAPEIEGMAPANYTGGSLKDKGVDGIDTLIAGGTGGAGTAAATPGIARGGGEGKPRRIAPTQVARATGQPLVGLFGSTTEGRVNFAKGLSAEQRAEEKARLEKALEAIATADKGKQRKRRTLRKRTTSFIKKQEDDEGDSESLGDDTTADESDSGSLIDDATIEKGDSESLGDGSEKIEDGSSLTTTDDTQMEGGKSEPSGNEPK